MEEEIIGTYNYSGVAYNKIKVEKGRNEGKCRRCALDKTGCFGGDEKSVSCGTDYNKEDSFYLKAIK